jgi:hypothetical protein
MTTVDATFYHINIFMTGMATKVAAIFRTRDEVLMKCQPKILRGLDLQHDHHCKPSRRVSDKQIHDQKILQSYEIGSQCIGICDIEEFGHCHQPPARLHRQKKLSRSGERQPELGFYDVQSSTRRKSTLEPEQNQSLIWDCLNILVETTFTTYSLSHRVPD